MKPTGAFARRLLAALGLRLALWMVVCALLIPGVLVQPNHLAGFHDEKYYFSHEAAAYLSLVEYHQLPQWNPWHCGGIPGIANPQDTALAPDFILRLLFGVAAGRRLAIIAFWVLGMEGLFRLARRHLCSPTASVLAAIAFATSGRMSEHVFLGWSTHWPLALLPWAVLAFELGLRSWRWRVAGGAILAWMILCGGTLTAPYTVVVLGVLTLLDTATALIRPDPTTRGPWYAPMLTLLTIGGTAAACASIRLLPMASVVMGTPRWWFGDDSTPPGNLLNDLLNTDHENYLGGWLLAAGTLGLFAFDRSARRFAGLALFFFLVAVGDLGPWSPYHLLHQLPVFDQLRLPHRYVIVLTLFTALAAARGLTLLEALPVRIVDGLRERWRRRRGRPALAAKPRWVQAALAIIGASMVVAVGYAASADWVRANGILPRQVFTQAGARPYDQTFRQSRGNRWDAHIWPAVGLGSLQCFEETDFPQSALLRGDLPAEEYPLDPKSAIVERVAWTPNRIDLHVVAQTDTQVIINQNYHRAWRTNLGEVKSHQGLLSVAVPAGDHRLRLAFRDPWIVAGACIWVLALLGLVALLGKDGWLRFRAWRDNWRELPGTSPEQTAEVERTK
jgi:hypothetical protein